MCSNYITFGDYQGKPKTASLFGDEVFEKIEFRPEQEEAITLALNHFCTSTGRGDQKVYTPLNTYQQFLWNAKMRFGKTLCALELARRMRVNRILIVTHRPIVDEGWHKDFKKIFHDTNYRYATRTENEQSGDFYALNQRSIEGNGGFVFFVSMQFLRLSELLNDKTQAKHNVKEIGENYQASNENERLKAEILKADWDLVVVDEAHEGTRTALGFRVIDEYLKKKSTKMLHLSGTPFNLYDDFGKNEIFTWDYISEQQAKKDWSQKHPGEPNPYAELPQMIMYSYDLGRNFNTVIDHDGLFTFSEFFRTWTGNPKADGAIMPDGAIGKFVHEDEVIKFLDLLCTKDDENNFPFATDEYRKQFRHTLWVVSYIYEAKALAALLRQHPKFKNRFKVINVAGNKESDEQMDNALDEVNRAIGEIPEQTATITISCGRLTTGVTVPPWTAVLYLKGGDSAATYMQTIFRVQSPYVTRDGRMKTTCCVFDFMFNRTLKIAAETSKFSSMAKAKAIRESDDEDLTQEMRDKQTVAAFIELCPLISMDGGRMSPLEVGAIYKQLESVFIDRLVTKGFDDPCLYVQEELNKIDPEILNAIGEKGGQAPDERRQEAKPTVDLSHMTEEQRKEWEEKIKRKKAAAAEAARKKAQKDEEFRKKWEGWSEEEREKYLQQEAEKQARREEAKKQREEFRKRITNIRGIALRIPLLMYGGADAGDTTEDLTVDNFTRKIKDESWIEFMPKGITKPDFNKIKRCFNATRFEEAGKRYREMTREADHMHISERIKRITSIFDSFRNPDKETVLTPWRAVNLHMSETLGGYCFFNERFDGPNEIIIDGKDGNIFDFVETNEPRYVDHGEVTYNVFEQITKGQGLASRVLEINSKTGLYPLYVAYTMYRKLLEHYDEVGILDNPIDNLSVSEEQAVWDDVVANNIFVICNTPMAAQITQRTLLGFRETSKKTNIRFDKLVERAGSDRKALIDDIKALGKWNGTKSKNMIDFDAVVGNPPYQGSARVQLYPLFYKLAIELGKYVSLIFPTGWQKPCAPTAKGLFKLNNEETKADRQIMFIDNKHDVFPGISGANEVNVILWQKDFDNGFDGKQMIFTDGVNPVLTQLRWEQTDDGKPEEIRILFERVMEFEGKSFKSVSDYVSPKDPYGIPTDIFSKPEKYDRTESDFMLEKTCDEDIKIHGGIEHRRAERYVSKGFPVKKNSSVSKYKVFVPWAWGNMDENAGLGGAYADIIIGEPNDVCTMTYNTCGEFDDYDKAKKHAKYMMTTFFRGLLYLNKDVKTSSRNAYSSIPYQSFSEPWWNESIEIIDKHLFEKYNASDLMQFFITNIQIKSESNILNLK